MKAVALLTVVSPLLAIGCAGLGHPAPEITADGKSAIALTGGTNTSMIYVARTDSGVLAIDLGWWGAEKPLAAALETIGARPADVRHVFLTHSHRDHIAAWPLVRQAAFHMSEPESRLFMGWAAHRGWIVRSAERLKSTSLPQPKEVEVRSFRRDTALVFGRDTLRAYIVQGHTEGSAVYLFRGVLFAGDAVTHSIFGRYKPAKRGFSDDPKLAAASLHDLWARLPADRVRFVCTAHGHCAPFKSIGF